MKRPPGVPPKQWREMESAAAGLGARMARGIRVRAGSVVTADQAVHLLSKHGGAPIPNRSIETGATVGEDIHINPALAKDRQPAVMMHELAHRLMLSARFEKLNHETANGYPRRLFGELVAEAFARHVCEPAALEEPAAEGSKWDPDGIVRAAADRLAAQFAAGASSPIRWAVGLSEAREGRPPPTVTVWRDGKPVDVSPDWRRNRR